MKRCLTGVLLIVYSISHAQDLVVNAPDFPGYYYTAYDVDTDGCHGGGNGEGQTWDFSHVGMRDSGVVYYFQPVNGNPYSTLFPEANYILYTLYPNLPVTFLYRNENIIGEIGQVSFVTNMIYYEWMKNHIPDTIAEYPIFYGKKKNYKNHFVQYSPKDSTKAIIELNMRSFIDGEGTLITPDNKPYHVLRQNRSVYQYAKAYQKINGKYKFIYTQEDFSTNYKWLCNELPFPFIYSTYKLRTVRTLPDDTVIEDTTVYCSYYYQTGKVMVSKDFNEVHLRVVRDMQSNIDVGFTCTTNYPGYLIINDMAGNCVLKKPVTPEAGINNETIQELETANLIPGTYIISFLSPRERGVVKWVKR